MSAQRKPRYQQLKDLIIGVQIQADRVPGREKFGVLKRVRMGLLDADSIQDGELWLLARSWLRVVSTQRLIKELDAASEQRQARAAERFLAALA